MHSYGVQVRHPGGGAQVRQPGGGEGSAARRWFGQARAGCEKNGNRGIISGLWAVVGRWSVDVDTPGVLDSCRTRRGWLAGSDY